MPHALDELSFEDRQRSMTERLGRRGVSDLVTGTIVVLPSLTFPPDELRKIVGIEYYEERMLCMTLLLRRPGLEIVYVTSSRIDDDVIDYYLSFVPDAAGARERLHLVCLDDIAPRALSEKLLEHAAALDTVRELLIGRDDAYLFPFNVTPLEQKIAERLGIAIYGPEPKLSSLGSKSGSRQLARVAGVPVAPGAEDLYSLDEIEQAAFELVQGSSDCTAIVVKLNNGFSGQGNVIIEADGLASPLDASRATFCAAEESWASFGDKVAREGAVVEQLIRADGIVSPSVQLRIFPDGSYEVVSTHDQILGGPDDQVYLGCRFPADDRYRARIQAYGLGIARELAAHGVVGSFGIDFVVTPDDQIFLAEINLRLGGTTHPFLMARFATEAAYDIASGELMVEDSSRVYVATDNIKSSAFVGIRPADVIAALTDARLAFDEKTKTGTTLHLLGALEPFGKLGAVFVGQDAAEAQRLYEETIVLLDRLQ